MTRPAVTPGLDRLERAMASSEMARIRRAVRQLAPEDRAVLDVQWPAETVTQVLRSARSRPRAARLGKVIVLHGLAGAQLDSVDARGDPDRVWLDFFRLAAGRLADLELRPDGKPASPDVREVRPAGLFPHGYLPILLRLDELGWDVRPFAYDWRLDISHSALGLARVVKSFGGGEPVHLVAHSMGGLVARRFIQLQRDLWTRMDDANGRRRGGRLVMLGTPNRGSFAIPLLLAGRELLVKALDLVDRPLHGRSAVKVTNTFPASYQLLPSPHVQVLVDGAPDDHVRLFRADVWSAGLDVSPDLLKAAESLHRDLHQVNDPERLFSVAGYDQDTPWGIRIQEQRFLFSSTKDGDGRVPHALGLLPGVETYFVREQHGALPRNKVVMEAVHELLLEGDTRQLPQQMVRGVRGAAPAAPPIAPWRDADQAALLGRETGVARLEAALRPVRAPPTARRRGAALPAVPIAKAHAQAQAEVLQDYLGPSPSPVTATAAPMKEPRKPAYTLQVEVRWDDIAAVDAELFAVGHYRGVVPMGAEWALDLMVSEQFDEWQALSRRRVRARTEAAQAGIDRELAGLRDRMVLRRLTSRGALCPNLGDVAFFPARRRKNGTPFLVGIAGMGNAGFFTRLRLRQLISNYTQTVATLPSIQRVCTVLIGSGEGTLGVDDAVQGLLAGLNDAFKLGFGVSPIRHLTIVERQLGKARRIQESLVRQAPAYRLEIAAQNTDLRVKPHLGLGRHGAVDSPHALAMVVDACCADRAVRAAVAKQTSSARARLRPGEARLVRQAIDEALQGLELDWSGRRRRRTQEVEKALARWRQDRKQERLLLSDSPTPPALELVDGIEVRLRDEGRGPDESPRLTYLRGGSPGIRVAAITQRATVSERDLPADPALVREQIDRMQDDEREPAPGELRRIGRLLRRLLVPPDFSPLIDGTSRLVFEVDRRTAAVPWEVMEYEGMVGSAGGPARPYLGLNVEIARQMRTILSPPPVLEAVMRGPWRALVIGDPGDPARGEDLPGAQLEARVVAELLQTAGFEVTSLIGAQGRSGSDEPASRSAVIDLLLGGEQPYDILHYCGHGDFDPNDPRAAGWLFADGILGRNELQIALERGAPPLVVANACLSGRTSETVTRGGNNEPLDELHLLPGLADTFFERGVQNYIGTSRQVDDDGAVVFARTFYSTLLDSPPASVGHALLAARRALAASADRFGTLWASYHHFGDPGYRVRIP